MEPGQGFSSWAGEDRQSREEWQADNNKTVTAKRFAYFSPKSFSQYASDSKAKRYQKKMYHLIAIPVALIFRISQSLMLSFGVEVAALLKRYLPAHGLQ
jgi:hypothetical protein